ncbi:hypothetical protein PR202_ga08079 [Eleusine coracana subsp. coracana]|uniref:F-box domain-containing protein n=1 Tax=Eleusine coracana subsp. coracana TaxID=191504 RepID=A0AAV5BZ89_ELECO|nr:hypothetical protein PR202_ga08079 [Eleusine coracana subsp. coracana]
MISSLRRRSRATPTPPPPLPLPPLDDDNLLSEILLRLSPHPAALLRASLVCRRWRRLVCDPGFLRLWHAFHGTAPVLGLYRVTPRCVSFIPIGKAPDRVPAPECFLLPDPEDWLFLGCRHGRVLFRSKPGWLQLLVWDPITGHRRCIRLGRLGRHVQECHATVLGDPGSQGRRCKGGSFCVAFVFTGGGRASACVYSSETGAWGRLITAAALCGDVRGKATALAGDALYWLLYGDGILELHLGKESMTEIEPPPGAQSLYEGNVQLMMAAGGALGFIGVKDYSLHLWVWDSGSDGGTAKWVLSKIIGLELFELLQLPGPRRQIVMVPPVSILGVDEGGDFAFLKMTLGIFKVHLSAESFMRVSDIEVLEFVRPYSSFYVAGMNN